MAKRTVVIPDKLHKEILQIMGHEGFWNSDLDFIRDAVKEKVERYRSEHAEYYKT